MSWQQLGGVAPTELAQARLQLHWAAQIIEAVARSVIAPAPDDAHTSAMWFATEEVSALESRPTATTPSVRVCLNLRGMEALIAEPDNREILARKALEGLTLDETLSWLSETFVSLGADAPALNRPAYDMPRHDIATGGRFARQEPAAFEELERWFANATLILDRVSTQSSNASPVRCWPHHFDIATLIAIDPDETGEQARSINVGFSPGDDSYDEPYWYVSPWPRPPEPELSELLSGGRWHTEGFLAAVLTGTRTVAHGEGQERAVGDFVDSATDASRRILGAGE